MGVLLIFIHFLLSVSMWLMYFSVCVPILHDFLKIARGGER